VAGIGARRWHFEVDVSHHAPLRVIEDVAMKHPHPRPFVEGDEEPHRPVDRHVDRVLPGHRMDRLKLLVEGKEPEAV
jgi:hypothetical protein